MSRNIETELELSGYYLHMDDGPPRRGSLIRIENAGYAPVPTSFERLLDALKIPKRIGYYIDAEDTSWDEFFDEAGCLKTSHTWVYSVPLIENWLRNLLISVKTGVREAFLKRYSDEVETRMELLITLSPDDLWNKELSLFIQAVCHNAEVREAALAYVRLEGIFTKQALIDFAKQAGLTI